MARLDDDELLARVHARLDGQPGRRRDEYHADCPYCGKEAKRGATHFSYSVRGCHCFVCGAGGGLFLLARMLGVVDEPTPTDPRWPATKLPPRPPVQPPPPPAWRSWGRAEYMAAYYPNATRVQRAWAASSYGKPIDTTDVARHWLGYGRLPDGHEDRLIVPIFDADGKLACLRGRATRPNGGPSWMTPAGWKLADLPLYNLHSARPGDTVVILENAVDAILLSRHYREEQAAAVAVATLSATYWNSSWEEALLAAEPARALVVFDNDLAGNGVSDDEDRARLVEEWRRDRGHEPPPARGPLVARRLNERGLQTVVYKYPPGTPAGADPGDFVSKIMGDKGQRPTQGESDEKR